MPYFPDLFWYRNLRVSDRFYVHHQESSTIYTATGICHDKYVEFYTMINLRNCASRWLFIIRIYHDARSSEYQINFFFSLFLI